MILVIAQSPLPERLLIVNAKLLISSDCSDCSQLNPLLVTPGAFRYERDKANGRLIGRNA